MPEQPASSNEIPEGLSAKETNVTRGVVLTPRCDTRWTAVLFHLLLLVQRHIPQGHSCTSGCRFSFQQQQVKPDDFRGEASLEYVCLGRHFNPQPPPASPSYCFVLCHCFLPPKLEGQGRGEGHDSDLEKRFSRQKPHELRIIIIMIMKPSPSDW